METVERHTKVLALHNDYSQIEELVDISTQQTLETELYNIFTSSYTKEMRKSITGDIERVLLNVHFMKKMKDKNTID